MMQYNPESKAANSFYSKFNPISKFIWLFSFSLTIYMVKSIIAMFFISCFTLFCVLIIGLKTDDLKGGISYLIGIQLVSATLFIYAWGDYLEAPLYYTFPADWPIIGGTLPIYRSGLYHFIRDPMMLLNILLTAVLFIITTNPKDLTASLHHQLRCSVSMSQCLAIDLNLIPMIQEETENIRAAQKSRGERLYGGSSAKIRLKESLKSSLSFFTTLIINVLRKVDCLSISLDKRALGLYETRTEKGTKWKFWDSLLVAFSIIFPIVVILYNVNVIKVATPSIFSLIEQIGVISWVNDNTWIFVVFFIYMIFSVILFLFYSKKKFSNKQKVGLAHQDSLLKNDITKEKIDNAANIIGAIL